MIEVGDEDGAAVPRRVFRMALVSELAPARAFSSGTPSDPTPRRVDKDSLSAVLSELAPTFTVPIADPISPHGEPLAIELSWRDLKSMKPDAMASEQSVLRGVLNALKLARTVAGGQGDVDHFAEQLARMLARPEWVRAVVAELRPAAAPKPEATPAPAADPKGLAGLLDKIDFTGTPATPASQRRASSIVAAVARGPKATAKRPRDIGRAVSILENLFVTLLTDVLHHPEVRRLSSAWLGLRWLVDRCDFRAAIELEVIAADGDRVEDALRSLADRASGDETRPPVDLVLVDQAVSEADLERIGAWAEIAADMRTPIVASGLSSLLGAASLAELDRASRKAAKLDDLVVDGLKGMAAHDAARWLSLVMNGPLVRPPYSRSSVRIAEAAFSQDPTDPRSRIFASPVLLVGVLAAHSHAESGWATDLEGARGVVRDLAVYELTEGGHSFALPLEAFVGESVSRAAGRAGIAIAGCAPNRDDALFFKIPMLHRDASGRATATLGDQLFTSRLAEAFETLASAIPAHAEAQAVEETAALVMSELFPGSKRERPELRIGLTDQGRTLLLSCRPRGFAGVSVEQIDLRANIGDR